MELDSFEDCRHFAKIARLVRLDELHLRFGMTWEQFCIKRLRQPADVVAEIVAGVEVLGEEAPLPAEVAQRAGRASLAQALAADPKVEKLADEGTPGPGRGHLKGGDAPRFSANEHSSTSAERIVRRLKRDAPEVAEALARGEYPSARAAGIEAGIVKVPSTLSKLRALWAKATADERDAFLAEAGQERRSTTSRTTGRPAGGEGSKSRANCNGMAAGPGGRIGPVAVSPLE